MTVNRCTDTPKVNLPPQFIRPAAQRLQGMGWTYMRIARFLGLSFEDVRHMLNGRRTHSHG